MASLSSWLGQPLFLKKKKKKAQMHLDKCALCVKIVQILGEMYLSSLSCLDLEDKNIWRNMELSLTM